MKKLIFFLVAFIFVLQSYGQWLQQSTGFTNPSAGVRYIHAIDEEVVWCTAYDGVNPSSQTTLFCKTVNGGTSWEPSEISGYTGYGTSMIFAIDGLTAWVPVFAPTGGGAILKTNDGGLNWTEQTTATYSAPSGFPNIVHFWNSDIGFSAGDPNSGYFEIYTTLNGGQNWTRVPHTNIPDPVAGDEYGVTGYFSVIGDTIWFSTNKGRLYKSIDKGNTWTVTTTPVLNNQFKVIFKNSTDGIIYDNQSNPVRIYESFDSGNVWTEILYSGQLFDVDICYVPGTSNTWISTGNNIGSSFSYDGGHNWELFPNTTGLSFLSVRFVSPTIGWSGDFTTDPFTGGINKYSGNLQPETIDVGVVSIDMPVLMEPGQIIPSVTFKNFGSEVQSFDVNFTISGVYASIVPIINLAPFQSIQVNFDQWIASIGNYDITVVTLLSNDVNSNNDFQEMQVEINDLTEVYGYVAFDPTGVLPNGPCKSYLEAPGVIISIDNQTTDNFIAAGTWGPDNKWFGAVYYDQTSGIGGELVTINTTTGERTVIGNMGIVSVNGISYDFSSDIMYATTYDGTTSLLYTVDISNASLTLIGETNSEILINLACNSSGDLFALDLVNDSIGEIDENTGKFYPLFSLGFDAAFAQDMEFDRYNDTCYMAAYNQTIAAGELYKVDFQNQSMILIDQFSGGAEITGFAIPFNDNNSISNIYPDNQVKLFPNPGSDNLNIQTDDIIVKVLLLDSNGNLIMEKPVSKRFIKLDINELPSGLYTLEIYFDDMKTIRKQFVKVK